MAIIAISDSGGAWNSTSTWVGGVIPGVNDDIVATATSGNLTLSDGLKVVNSIDFTNYVGTFTWNQGIRIGNGNSSLGLTSSIVLSPTMGITTSYTNWHLSTNNTRTGSTNYITTNGKVIPMINTGDNTGSMNVQIMDPLTVYSLWISGNQANYFNGATISMPSPSVFYNVLQGNNPFSGTSTIVVTGSPIITTTGIGNKLIIDSPSSIQVNSLTVGARIGTYSFPADVTYIKGNLSSRIMGISNNLALTPATPNKINTGSQTFSILFKETGTNHQYVSQIGGINKIYWDPSRTTLGSATFLGSTPLVSTTILPGKIYLTASTTGVTHSLFIEPTLYNTTGLSRTNNTLICGTPSSIAVQFGTSSVVQFGTSSVDTFYTAFTNINSLSSVYTYQGTFSNSTNISVVNSLAPTGFAGGGPSSTTFLM